MPEPMTPETVLRLGRAVGRFFQTDGDRQHKVLIGKDTRVSGYMIETALASGLTSMGVDVLLVGPMPTPGIAVLTRSMRADAGVSISASHNPFEDNGIKFFGPDAFKLPDADEALIEELMLGSEIDRMRPTAGAIGKARRVDDADADGASARQGQPGLANPREAPRWLPRTADRSPDDLPRRPHYRHLPAPCPDARRTRLRPTAASR